MGISGATPLTWSHTVSPSLQLPPPLFTRETRRFRVCCGSDQNPKGNQMIVSVTGATGFIGRRLVQRLHADNHSVHVLTRSKSKAELIFPVKDFPGIKIAEEPEWKASIQGSTGVVNLAGLPISTRWSSEIKKEIKESRIRVTSKIVELINSAPDDLRPKVLVSATAVGYYGTSETQVFDEQSPSGKDYLAEVCREWESTAVRVNGHVRVALIRIGVVLGKDGGALAKMIPLFMMFAGGPLGSGKQWYFTRFLVLVRSCFVVLLIYCLVTICGAISPSALLCFLTCKTTLFAARLTDMWLFLILNLLIY